MRLAVPGAQSLKQKRQVVQSLIVRIRSAFNVSVSEVDDHDLCQTATIAIACVSNDRSAVNAMLSKAQELIDKELRVQIQAVALEID